MLEQILCHLVGDYWLQNDWMALNKKKKFWIACVHAVVYTLPFALITESWQVLVTICITHAIIDGTNIVAKLNEWKNTGYNGEGTYYSMLINKRYPYSKYCSTIKVDACYNIWSYNRAYDTVSCISIEQEPGGILGFCSDRPAWICWLIHIVQDNTLHLLCNYLAFKYLVV